MVRVTSNKKFDNFIMFCIIVNSVAMGMFDYYEDNKCLHDHCVKNCP